MNTEQESTERGPGLRAMGGRKPVSVASHRLVRRSYLAGAEGFPLVLEPEVKGLEVEEWGRSARERLMRELEKHGAILLRGFGIEGVEEFEGLARAITPELLDYRERSSPRQLISRGVYTSTDHPAEQHIHFHNEQSYTQNWPMRLWFFCQQPAAQGGATPIADGRKVLQLLDADIRERFLRKGVMYVRNYGDGIGLSWQEAFQTTSRRDVEEYCRQAAIECEWKDNNRLRTRQLFRAIVAHPRTQEPVWFEHTAFFHLSSLEPDVRATFTREFAEEDFPFNTYYGDGERIEASVLDEIRQAYRETACVFSWQKGDVLLIDNMLVSHAREPFVPPRKVLVAMADLIGPRIAQSFVE
jgi:alpha-ketoglutarate-dependent taurine dioxygenase